MSVKYSDETDTFCHYILFMVFSDKIAKDMVTLCESQCGGVQ